ncbi:hypothetical protein D3C81_1720790 [compost metagenome]
MLEGHGLLDFRVDRKVLAPQVGQAVVLPLQQITGAGGGAGRQQAAGEDQAVGNTHRVVAPLIDSVSVLWCGTFWVNTCLLGQFFSIGHSCLARAGPTFRGGASNPARRLSEQLKMGISGWRDACQPPEFID